MAAAADIAILERKCRGITEVVVARLNATRNPVAGGIITAIAVWCALSAVDACASEEFVDRATKAALTLDAHPDRGGAQFARHCTRCHGLQAQGDAERAIPALAGQRFAYLVRQLANFAGGERDSDTMHRVVSQKEIRGPQTWVDVASYLNRVPRTDRVHDGDGKRLALGRAIFHEQCASCHAGDAHGDEDGFVPSLRNQHYRYLLGQMHKLGQGYRHNVDENLVRFLGNFDEQDMQATADYLSRLRGPGAVHEVMRLDGVVVD
jgi:cytochrome c553